MTPRTAAEALAYIAATARQARLLSPKAWNQALVDITDAAELARVIEAQAAAPDALREARRYGSVAMPDGSVLGPLAAPAVPAAIDVERLARALDNLHADIRYVGPGHAPDPTPTDIASEYERLS